MDELQDQNFITHDKASQEPQNVVKDRQFSLVLKTFAGISLAKYSSCWKTPSALASNKSATLIQTRLCLPKPTGKLFEPTKITEQSLALTLHWKFLNF